MKDFCKKYFISRSILSIIYKLLRSKVRDFLANKPIKLVEMGIICLINEPLFVHKDKYHRVRCPRMQICVFGIVDTSTSHAIACMKFFEDCPAATLPPIVQEVCLPGTIIHSDMWAGTVNSQNEQGLTMGQFPIGLIL
ncbi:hypothetical protein NGRA_2062 [Nosema granulosis]|uniref:Transposase n=1 Tax=Nosema granulosis TaxID=83296 RepID=A0A9P6GXU6_9MICR|nr:hypothetical protein NGRA_2062 [Nosema granulosis]